MKRSDSDFVSMENVFNADDYDLRSLGIINCGTFNRSGSPTDWSIDSDIDYELPRMLLEQPVLFIDTDTGNVYVRGMYSAKLTLERKRAMR